MRNTIGLLFAIVSLTGGGPTQPEPHEAPGGFIFRPAPASVAIYRDTLLVAVVTPDSTDNWIELNEEEILVQWTDPKIPSLEEGIYEYRIRGRYGKQERSPYATTKNEAEVALIIEKGQICVRRSGNKRCTKTKKSR